MGLKDPDITAEAPGFALPRRLGASTVKFIAHRHRFTIDVHE
jgi:hypothetical protein